MIDTSSLRSLVGKHVVGEDGGKIGKIADVYESTDGGGGTYATVTTGLFGGGSSFFPLEAAQLRDDEVAVPYTKDFVKDAPRVENDEELSAAEEERLFAYYGLGSTAAGDAGRREPADRRSRVEHPRDGQPLAERSRGEHVGGGRLRRYVGEGGETEESGEPGVQRHPVTAAHLSEQPVVGERSVTDRGAHVLPGSGAPDAPASRTP